MIIRIIILICFVQHSYSQNIYSFDLKNRLSQNTVTAIAEDSQGYLWLGTPDGLNRYDGRTIRSFRKRRDKEQSICGNEITAIEKDSIGNLWIGTSSGLSRLDLGSYEFTNYDNTSLELPSNYILDLNIINKHLCVLTPKGIGLIDIRTGKVNRDSKISELNIKQIAKGESNEIIYSTDNQISKYNFVNQNSEVLLDEKVLTNSDHAIQKLYYHQGHFFVAYSNTLVSYSNKDSKAYSFKTYKFLDTHDIEYWNNKIYFSTSKGLIAFDLTSKEYTEEKGNNLPDGVALNTQVNDSDELIVSVGTELVKISGEKPIFEIINVNKLDNNFSGSNKIWHICNDMNMLILSSERGIYVLNENGSLTTLSTMIPYIPNILVASNVIRDKDNIWISTFDEGFYHIDLKIEEVTNYSSAKEAPYYIKSNTVRHSVQTDSTVYLSTDGGLYVFDKSRRNVELISLERMHENSIERVNCSALDRDENLWIGTQNGLYCQKRNGQTTYHSTESANPISDNRILCLKSLNDSILLVGTSSGLNYYNRIKDTNKVISVDNGLNNDVIYSIEIDNDNDIWTSTNLGLSQIGSNFEIVNFNEFDGLPTNQFNANSSAIDSSGDLYFGSLNGVARFNHSETEKIDNEIKPIISEIEILPYGDFQGMVHRYPLQESYTLRNDHSNFTIRFSSINFINPENDNFEYRLVGYSDNWVKVSNKLEVQFMNLDQGQYTFELRGTDRKGRPYNFVDSISITIEPPYYSSTWFKLAALSVLMGFIGISVWFRIKQSDKRNLELKAIVKRQTEKLEYSNKLKEEFLKQVPEPLVIYDREKNIVLSNDLFEELKERHYIDDTSMIVFNDFLDRNIISGIEKIQLGNDKTYSINTIYNDIYFELKFSELILDSKEYGISVLVRDVTKIKKAEISLRKSDLLFRSYFEKSPIGIIYIEDPSGNIVNCNSKFCQIVNMTKDEVLSKTMMDISHPDDLQKDIQRFKNAYANGHNYLFEPNKRLLCTKGIIAITETHVTFIYDDAGNYQYMFALINDVTEQRENQKKLLEVKTKLIQSEKLASLGQLTAGVAHEINNPVNFIYNGVNNLKNLVKSIQTNNVDDKELVYIEIQQMISAIDEGARRTTDIVKSLRMFTKEDIKSKTPYNILLGLKSSLLLLTNKTKDRIRIIEDLKSQEIIINCYPGQLNQVFMNVLTNAIESISESGTITILAEKSMSNAAITIKDTGSGIPPDLYTKVFEPFYSTKGAKNGTGLGLSISHSIIEKHNGTISIKNNEPHGTAVTISLPIV